MGEVFDRYTDTVGNYHYSDTETGHHVMPKDKYEYHYDHTDCPERKTGKWIGYNADKIDWQRDDGSPIFLNCSECHATVVNNGSAYWNFCPNCGARMEGQS